MEATLPELCQSRLWARSIISHSLGDQAQGIWCHLPRILAPPRGHMVCLQRHKDDMVNLQLILESWSRRRCIHKTCGARRIPEPKPCWQHSAWMSVCHAAQLYEAWVKSRLKYYRRVEPVAAVLPWEWMRTTPSAWSSRCRTRWRTILKDKTSMNGYNHGNKLNKLQGKALKAYKWRWLYIYSGSCTTSADPKFMVSEG